MGIRLHNRLSAERYLSNKEHFDQGLINALEHLDNRVLKLTNEISVYEANKHILNSRHRKQTQKLSRLEVENHNLKARLRLEKDDAEKEIEQIIKNSDEIFKIHQEELERAYKEIEDLYKEIGSLKDEIKNLKSENGKLEYRLNINSNNSSMPPSSDFIKPKPTSMRQKTGLKVGGQKGHTGHFSKINKKPNRIIERYVKKAPTGAKAVYCDESSKILYYITQEIDMVLDAITTETRYYVSEAFETLDTSTMKRYKINSVSYSDDFKSKALFLNHQGIISLNRTASIFYDLSDSKIDLKPSTIVNWNREFHHKSETARKEILKKILSSDVVHVDETSWRIDGENAWLHTICTEEDAYFLITKSRYDKVNGPVHLLSDYESILVHDHFKPYYHLNCVHSECNAHIMRYLKRGWESTQDMGCLLMMNLFKKMLKHKTDCIEKGIYRIDNKTLENYRLRYRDIVKKTQAQYKEKYPHIKKGSKYEDEHIKLMRRLERNEQQHLMFLEHFQVPFDNNQAERQIRICKTKKKVSGQSKNIENANFYTSLHTVIRSSYLKEKNTLKAIKDIMSL